MTPDYPSNYEDNIICNWEVTSPIQTTIKLAFDDFETEECCDELKIYDGPSMKGNMMEFRGTTVPAFYQSTGNSLYLQFKSDHSSTRKGFNLSYSWEGRNANTSFLAFFKIPHFESSSTFYLYEFFRL